MTREWALLNQDFYTDAILYAIVNSGVYDQLVIGATTRDLNTFQSVLMVPWALLVNVLKDLGCIEQEGGKWWWTADPPAVRSLHRMDIMRRWLNMSQCSTQNRGHFLKDAVQSSEDARLRDSSLNLNQWILEAMSLPKPVRWLDVGGGSGTLAMALANQGIEVTMIDTVDTIRKVSGTLEHPLITLVGDDVCRQIPAGPYDIVSLIRFIENFTPQTTTALFKQIRRQVHSQGRLVAVITEDEGAQAKVFFLEVYMNAPEGHLYSFNELKVIAAKSGWKIDRVSQRGHLMMVVFSPLRIRIKKHSESPLVPVTKCSQVL